MGLVHGQGGKAMRRRTVTATNEQGQNIRVSLGEPAWEGKEPAGTGVWLTGLWIGRHRVVAEYDSIWEDHNHPGCCIGTYYEAVSDPGDVIRLCDMAEVEPPSFVPVEEV
jgi:hypothetical protein